jgi:hypothetical protein
MSIGPACVSNLTIIPEDWACTTERKPATTNEQARSKFLRENFVQIRHKDEAHRGNIVGCVKVKLIDEQFQDLLIPNL